jgi:hypothetical protein
MADDFLILNGGFWPDPEPFTAGHALPESQINELPFENFL